MEKRSQKPAWVIEKERSRKAGPQPVWLFGLHAVRDALLNPRREIEKLIVTRNAAEKLGDAIAFSGVAPEEADPRRFPAPLDPGSVHQGAAALALPLDWGRLEDVCAPDGSGSTVVLLDRVTDPHNVGAILRSAEVFGARAVIAPLRHAAPETGALAKAASGALERQPYLRVKNLGAAIETLRDEGYFAIGLEGEAQSVLPGNAPSDRPLALVFGAEGPGLRPGTLARCDLTARIEYASDFGSLNVSNAVAVSLHAVRERR